MKPDDSVRDMIAGEVHAARRRNEVSDAAIIVPTKSIQKVAQGDLVPTKSIQKGVPDPDEVLVVRCAYCARIIRRPRRVVERDNRRHGFITCRHACRKAQLALGERILVPERESATE